MTNNENKSKGIQSVARAIDILKCFDEFEELGVTEISKILGLHKSTTFGLVSTLEIHKFLERNPITGKYKLGVELFRFGNKVKTDIRAVVRPYLEKLVELFEETVHLVVRDDIDVLYLDKIESPHSMRICSQVGARLPMYCTGVGKAILAQLRAEEVTDIISRTSFRQFTDFTITDQKLLIAQLEDIRLRGYAEDIEELEIGLRCIAAPIFNHTNKVIGAISVAGPTMRMKEEILVEISKVLITFAAEISKKLGYIK